MPYRGYELEELTLVPRPSRLPVECWQPIVSANPRGILFMTEHGIKGFMGGAAAAGAQAEKMVTVWRDAILATGRDAEMGTDLAIGIPMHIADTQEKAILEASKLFEEN
ncbi:MAG: hypothetical protein QGI09_04525, partial [Dehalococcoidia bacterium]|nr:hypothetical protein [Dehalococcoidia bacterium]